MPKVSDEHKDAVRRRIMDAALVCLRRSGYADITTRELLAEAGLSTGTFYNYFPSKEDLYEALAEELLADDVARLVDAADAPGASIGFGLLRLLADQAFVDPEAAVAIATFRSRLHASADAAEAIGRLNAFIVAQFAPLLARAQAEGTIRPDLDADAAVELLDIIWDGLGRRQATDTFETSYQRVGAVVLALLADGLVPGEVHLTPDLLAPRPGPTPNPRYRSDEAD